MRRSPALAAALLLTAAAIGQGPPAWADLHLPGGVGPAAVQALGKLVAVQEPGRVHVFSAFTRRWHLKTVAGTPALRLCNDLLLFPDGGQWVAFSALSGRFAALPVGPSAQLLNPANQRNDSILLVRDGGLLHAFSGFTGAWVSRPVGAAVQVAVQRHVALLADGTLLSAMDAFTGAWHDLTLPGPATALSADGAAGVAEAGGTLHGFSAPRGNWASAPALPGSASFQRHDDWTLWHDGATALAFSGLTGSFASAATGAPGEVAAQEDVLAIRTGSAVHLYSPLLSAFHLTGLGLAGTMRASTAVVLLADGRNLQAYSAVTGQVAQLTLDSSGEILTSCAIAAAERTTGRPWLFSALTGAFHQAPPNALPGLPRLQAQSALLATATGFLAWSARTGAFVPLASPGLPEGNQNSSVAAVWDDHAFHAFEARRDAWLAVPRTSAGSPNLQIWRTTLVAADGATAHGFGAQAGVLHSVPLPEPVVGLAANSECGHVLTAHHVLAFGAVPEPLSLWQFPEFRRALPLGATFRLHLRLPQGSAAFLGGGPRRASPLPVPGLGDLLLDPAWTTTLFTLPDPGEDRRVLLLPTAAAFALRGTEWWFQALVLPATGLPYLSDASTLLLL